MMKILTVLFFVAMSVILGGCATPESIVKTPLTARPQALNAVMPPTNGSIYQAAAYRPMFEDRRARLIGDTITIVINENSTAGKLEGSSGSKTGSVAAAAPNVFGLFSGLTNPLSASASNADSFADKGAVTSSNNFISTLTVTVVDVMSNGNMVVSGEKQIALDKGSEFIRFSGVVDPTSVSPGNLVSSTRVADAKIEYRTDSKIDAAQIAKTLGRFFFSVLPL